MYFLERIALFLYFEPNIIEFCSLIDNKTALVTCAGNDWERNRLQDITWHNKFTCRIFASPGSNVLIKNHNIVHMAIHSLITSCDHSSQRAMPIYLSQANWPMLVYIMQMTGNHSVFWSALIRRTPEHKAQAQINPLSGQNMIIWCLFGESEAERRALIKAFE